MRIFWNYKRPELCELLSLAQKREREKKKRKRERRKERKKGEREKERKGGKEGKKKVGREEGGKEEGGREEGRGGKRNNSNNKADFKAPSPTENDHTAILIFMPHHRQCFWNIFGFSISAQFQQLNTSGNTSATHGKRTRGT